MQSFLINNLQQKQTVNNTPNQYQNQLLLDELLKKKAQVGDLQKENLHLANEYLKVKDNKSQSTPIKVLEEMVKDKNQVKNTTLNKPP